MRNSNSGRRIDLLFYIRGGRYEVKVREEGMWKIQYTNGVQWNSWDPENSVSQCMWNLQVSTSDWIRMIFFSDRELTGLPAGVPDGEEQPEQWKLAELEDAVKLLELSAGKWMTNGRELKLPVKRPGTTVYIDTYPPIPEPAYGQNGGKEITIFDYRRRKVEQARNLSQS